MTVIALAGNPNCGKTTLFNALTGSHQHVGNWPGVTVERRSGFFQGPGGPVEVVDLPGTYSLSAQGEDERIAAATLADPAVQVIVNVLDAANLERNLYLTTQLLELGRPMVFVLNMMDEAGRKGLKLDQPALAALLGGPVVATVGNREQGIRALRAAILEAAQARGLAVAAGTPGPPAPGRTVAFGADLDRELARLEREIRRDEALALAAPPAGSPCSSWNGTRAPWPRPPPATPATPSPPRSRPAWPSWNPTWGPTGPPWWPSGATGSPMDWWRRSSRGPPARPWTLPPGWTPFSPTGGSASPSSSPS